MGMGEENPGYKYHSTSEGRGGRFIAGTLRNGLIYRLDLVIVSV